MELGQTATETGGGAAIALDVTPTTARLDMIDPSPFNPRKTFNGLAELGASLAARWIVPLCVRPHPKVTGRYEIVDGERRFRAAKGAKIVEAPINLVHMSDQEVRIAQHVSYQREDLKPLERAASYKAMGEAGLSAKEIGKHIGMSVETVFARLKLLSCIEPVQKALNEGALSEGHGVLIARLEPKVQERILRQCINGGGEAMSVRELNQVIEWDVRDQKRRAERKAQPPVKREPSKPAVDWKAKRAKQEAARQRERAVRRAILDAALESVKAPLERADLEFAVEGLLDRTVAGEKERKELAALKPQKLGHLLIEVSLDGELEAWGGSKPERLLAFAKRHKVNVDRVRAAAEKEYAAKLATAAQTPAQPKTAKAGAK